MGRRRLLPLLPALAAAGAFCGCGSGPPPNVLLVSIDTLRADAVGAYGGPVATPALDGLAGQGVLFAQAIAGAPETGPSHATLFTGLEVLRHGLVHNGVALPEEVETLAEAFHAAGYRTGGFVSTFVLDPRFGWSRGFDVYDAEFPKDSETLKQRTPFWSRHDFDGFDRRAPGTNARAIPWLAEVDEPFFAFVHYYDPHLPYLASQAQTARIPVDFARRAARERIAALRRSVPGARAADLEDALRRYQAEVVYADRALAALLEALALRGLGGRTLVVVTSDHGEGLGEHGCLDHAPLLYEEQLRVPLVMRWPGRIAAGARVDAPVGLVDVAPTVAALAGVELAGDGDGRSLAPLLLGESDAALEARPVLGRRRRYPRPFQGHRGVKFFVRTARWKYIRASEDPDELYDLAADPHERRNVREQQPEVQRRLAAILDARLAAHPLREPAPALSDEDRRALEALGYAE